MDQDNYEVIIIGAGLAGLSSARTLTRSGINDFLILEGQNATRTLDTRFSLKYSRIPLKTSKSSHSQR
jgi:cation diffusion facilitator CzcD-associated flavoprotein CzcO